ncbi:hypothetical protein [Streptomyces mirabilis]|uniref:hypothetical protein n=1 Tax=Streptomyces mirabilis TaxID=68239 RepID=UPI0036D873C8
MPDCVGIASFNEWHGGAPGSSGLPPTPPGALDHLSYEGAWAARFEAARVRQRV